MRSGLLPRSAVLALLALVACEPRETETRPPVTQLPRPPAPTAAPPTTPSEAPPLARLPDDVKPHGYALSLEVDPAKERYSGVVSIKVSLEKPRDLIWLHAKGLHAVEASITPDEGSPIAAELASVDPGGVAALRLARPIDAGSATIKITFDAPFGARLEGLYRVARGGVSYAFTQFESIFARQAFPCFDEPAYKTPFDLTLLVPKGQAAIANTPEKERVAAQGGLERVTFATTAPLPTYLVALAVGPLDVIVAPPIPPNDVRSRALPFRGVAVRGRGGELAHALAETPKLVAALEKYFGIEYPFEKLDIIAVPDKQGAMENAGAITFGEPLLLLDPKMAALSQRRTFAEVMTHELAHQWVGDLVTMGWWDDTWLNESFATWAASRRTAEAYPDFELPTEKLADAISAMGADSLVAARQIRQPVLNNDDIQNAFDWITYTKGGAVLEMFERWVGEKPFQKGLKSYLDAHRFGTGSSPDFTKAISDASKMDVTTAMGTFLNQPGVPMVEAELVCDAAKKAPAKLHMKQARYFPLGSSGKSDALWQIPVCARVPVTLGGKPPKPSGDKRATSKENRRVCTLLTTREGDLDLGTNECPAWVLPNASGEGYYRFAMPAEQLKRLGIAAPKLGVLDRMAYAASVRAAFSSGAAPGDDVLRALVPLAQDPSRHVADLSLGFVRSLEPWLDGDPLQAKLLELGRKLAAPALKELGWEPKAGHEDTSEQKLLRANVIDFAALFARDPAVRKEALKRGRAFLGLGGDGKLHREVVAPDLAQVVLTVAVQDGEVGVFDAALERLLATDDDAVRTPLLVAAASSKRPEQAAKMRAFMLEPRARPSDISLVLSVQLNASDPAQRKAAWGWLKENVDRAFDRYPPARRTRLLNTTKGSICEATELADWTSLFESRAKSWEGGPRAYAASRETVELCIARRKAQEPSVRSFLGGAKGRGH